MPVYYYETKYKIVKSELDPSFAFIEQTLECNGNVEQTKKYGAFTDESLKKISKELEVFLKEAYQMGKKQSFSDELKERERHRIDEHIDFVEQSKIDVDTIPDVKDIMIYNNEKDKSFDEGGLS